MPGLPTPPSTPPASAEQEGKRLVGEVADSWSSRYIFHIRHGGRKDGLYHYECLFSRPTDGKPVPSIVIAVFFAFLPGVGSRAPRLFYQFEEGDLRHEWSLKQDPSGTWRAAKGQPILSLRHDSFERYLDAYIREKETVRSRGISLITKYEQPRLTPPPATHDDQALFEETGSASFPRQESTATVGTMKIDPLSLEIASALQDALKAANMYCDKVAPPSSLTELLANILDAADEDGTGRMSHYEVSRLLMATLPGFGLEEWDIHHFLTLSTEDDDGFIESSSLVEQAHGVVFALRQRRAIYVRKGLPGMEISNEAIKHCYSEELTQTVDDLTKLLEACAAEVPGRALFLSSMLGASMRRPSGGSKDMTQTTSMCEEPSVAGFDSDNKELVALKRRYLRECLQALHERISPQEAAMLMQMLPEDENGFVMIDDLVERWEQLRTESLCNAVVACNMKALRVHLVTRFREVGMDEYGRMKIWRVKDALLRAEEVCLSRLHIHVLLSLADPDREGNVDMTTFAGMCSSIMPHMLSAKLFTEIAERLILEHAEVAKERANAELAALGAARVTTAGDHDGEEHTEKKVEVDQDTVERTLIQVFSLSDDTRKPTPVLLPETIFRTLMYPTDQQVQSLCLDELEVAGLVAEMQPDLNGEVPYHDFVKRWVPILFELRRNPHLGAYLKAGAAEKLGFPEPDLDALEELHPLLPEGHREAIMEARRALEQQHQKQDAVVVQRDQRRGSKEAARRGSKERVPRRMGTLPAQADGDERAKVKSSAMPAEKEPPPGRGYLRRKANQSRKRLEETEIAKEAAPEAAGEN